MAGTGVEAGWFIDPSEGALLRWWDGVAWTDHTLDGDDLPSPSQTEPAGPPPRGAPPAAGDERLAVIDVETTGLYRADRIVEVAVVTIDGSGAVVDEFESLVNPLRDVGPTWLHGVTASMVANAPTFDDVAHHIASRVDGAICIGHNLPFDERMLGNQLAAAGIEVRWGGGFDTLPATGRKLHAACAAHGIELGDGAHTAIGDARATAQLFLRLVERPFSSGTPASARPVRSMPIKVCTRSGDAELAEAPPYLAGLASGVHAKAELAPYIDLLDRAISDLQLSVDERAELAAMAAALDLDSAQVACAHRDFLHGLIDAALEDLVITDAEHDQICRAAALLDIDPKIVESRTTGHRGTASSTRIAPGMRVCFTGAATDLRGRAIQRSQLEEIAIGRGLVPTTSSTSSGCDLLVAADPASMSGKAANARRQGVPITSVADFLAAREDGDQVASMSTSPARVALVCIRCGTSWLAVRSSSAPICDDCR